MQTDISKDLQETILEEFQDRSIFFKRNKTFDERSKHFNRLRDRLHYSCR